MSKTQPVPAGTQHVSADSPLTISSITDGIAWIVHAAPPENGQNALSDDGDSVWYARTFDEYFSETAAFGSIPLNERVREGVHTTIDLFSSRVDDLDTYASNGFPSAMFASTRWNEDENTFEYFCLGDTVLLFKRDGDLHRVCASDGSLHDPDYSPNDQWCLSFRPEAIDYARYGTLPADEIDGFHIFTTGLDAAIEVYDMYDDWEAFFDDVDARDIHDVIGDINSLYDEQGPSPSDKCIRTGTHDIEYLTLDFSRT